MVTSQGQWNCLHVVCYSFRLCLFSLMIRTADQQNTVISWLLEPVPRSEAPLTELLSSSLSAWWLWTWPMIMSDDRGPTQCWLRLKIEINQRKQQLSTAHTSVSATIKCAMSTCSKMVAVVTYVSLISDWLPSILSSLFLWPFHAVSLHDDRTSTRCLPNSRLFLKCGLRVVAYYIFCRVVMLFRVLTSIAHDCILCGSKREMP